MTPALVVLAIFACGIGALARYAINQLGARCRFPWATVVANALGSGVLGAVVAAVLTADAPAGWLLVLGGGFAGGLSTVSTLAVDALVLWQDSHRRGALTYVAATLTTGCGAASLGWVAAVAVLT